MHHLQIRRFSGDGPLPIARIRTPPGPRKGALQSLQRGGDGTTPQMRRMRGGKSPVSILPHISSDVSLAIGEGPFPATAPIFFGDLPSGGGAGPASTGPRRQARDYWFDNACAVTLS